MLAAKVEAQEAERAAEETERKLLQQTVEAARAEARAAEAERTNLEMRSQLYASIGIMAGSYAHNIKNLLVRPNDLINRCLEADRLRPEQTTMLHEVQVHARHRDRAAADDPADRPPRPEQGGDDAARPERPDPRDRARPGAGSAGRSGS